MLLSCVSHEFCFPAILIVDLVSCRAAAEGNVFLSILHVRIFAEIITLVTTCMDMNSLRTQVLPVVIADGPVTVITAVHKSHSWLWQEVYF